MTKFKLAYPILLLALASVGCSSSDDDSGNMNSTGSTDSSDGTSTDGNPLDDPGDTDGSSDAGTDGDSTTGGDTDGSSAAGTDGDSTTGGDTDGSSDGSDGGSTSAGTEVGVCRTDTRLSDSTCTEVGAPQKFALINFASQNNDRRHEGGGVIIDVPGSGGIYADLENVLRSIFDFANGDAICYWVDLQEGQQTENEFTGNGLFPQDFLSIVLLNGGTLGLVDGSGNFTGELIGDTTDFQGQQLTFYQGFASALSKYLIFPGTQEVQATQIPVNLPGIYTPTNTIFSPGDTGNGFSWTVEGVEDKTKSVMFVTWHFQRPNGDRYNLDCISNGTVGQIAINATGTAAPEDAALIRLQTSVGTVTVAREGDLVVLVMALSLVDETMN